MNPIKNKQIFIIIIFVFFFLFLLVSSCFFLVGDSFDCENGRKKREKEARKGVARPGRGGEKEREEAEAEVPIAPHPDSGCRGLAARQITIVVISVRNNAPLSSKRNNNPKRETK